MADGTSSYAREVERKDATCSLTEFARCIDRHASTMERSGWLSEASHLRKWASELRGKSLGASHTRDLAAGL